MKTTNLAAWVLQVATAAILAQTLFFKFTAAPESVYIFRTLGIEPYGRIGTGVAELIAVVLLLIPATAVYGALLAVGIISGEILGHLTKLGIPILGDGGLLFGLAVAVLVLSLGILFLRRKQLPLIN